MLPCPALLSRSQSDTATQGDWPNTTACMMRPGRKVKIPAMTNAPTNRLIIARRCLRTSCCRARHTASGSIARVKIDSKWIGLNGPHSRIVWMKNELSTTASISTAQIQPIARCGIVPFGAASCSAPSAKAPSAAKAWIWMTGGAASSGARFIAGPSLRADKAISHQLALSLREIASSLRSSQLQPGRRWPPSRAGDEGAQRLRLELDLVEAVLDEVADADDAAQPPVGHDREMADAPVGHLGHQFADRVAGLAGDDVAGHDPADRERQEIGGLLGKRDHDIALRQDAIDAIAVLADDDRADPLPVQHVDRVADRRVRPDRRDPIALVAQDRLDIHRGLQAGGSGGHARRGRSHRRLA